MSEEARQPKRKRRWLRFSLRTFLLLLTVLCIWLCWNLYRVERQREAVKWVRENGGTVYYDFEMDSDGEVLSDSQPPVAKWLHEILGVDFFSTVRQVGGFETQVSDVKPLAALTKLNELLLNHTQVSNVAPLAGLTTLEVLWLHNTQVDEVTPLAGLTNLNNLSLHNTPVSDITPLAKLKNLRWLDLSYTQFSDVTQLAGLTNLKSLRLYNTQVSDVTPLADITNLERLWLDGVQISDEEIEKLKLALPNCRIIH